MSKEDRDTPENAPPRKDQTAKGPASRQGSMADKGGRPTGPAQGSGKSGSK